MTRREFLGLAGAGAVGTLLAAPNWAAFELQPEEFRRWQDDVMAPAHPRIYLSDKHADARMHLGGLGTGNFEIGADGQLTTWQLFNTLRDGNVPLYFLANAGGTTKLLQTTGGPDWPRVQQIQMTGEYPVAVLRFTDPGLPVRIELTAFSPFAPLDTRFSEMPLAAFVFQIRNPTGQSQTVSLAALMQNPVGYDARGENRSATNPDFGGNVNDVLREARARGLFMRAEPAKDATLDGPVAIYASANLSRLETPPPDRPDHLTVNLLGAESISAEALRDPVRTVIWLEEPAAEIPASFLQAARAAVRSGATLLFAGKSSPLLQGYGSCTGGKPLADVSTRPDILFEDFEHGYENWKVEGNAFGRAPARGTLPNQQPVSGFVGHGLVNSYLGGDDATGRLISKPFTIERRFIRFRIGGGSSPNTQIRLVADGKVVRSASGEGRERLQPAFWDVSALEGRTAHIEIVDEQQGGWGHINVDQIQFSDFPGDRAVLSLLEEMLPARFSGVRSAGGRAGGVPAVAFEDLVLQPGAIQATAANGLRLFIRPLGTGKVVMAAGAVLDPASAGQSRERQRAYEFLCRLVGANYTPAAGPGPNRKASGFGTLALAALRGETTVLPAFEDWSEAWNAFSARGRFAALHRARPNPPTPSGRTINGAVASTIAVPAGETVEVPFVLTWHYPNKYNSAGVWMGCHYATRWPDAVAVAREAAENITELQTRTERFRKTFYDSTLPYWLLDCVTANAGIIRHIGVVFRIANGEVYGWEGSNGCCEPTCTHVWGYEQTLARLFPTLEREMRRIDFRHQQRPDGGINNRTDVPSPPWPTNEHPFTDGQASCILKAYREALNSSDETFFRSYWPNVRRAVEYLIHRDAKSNGGRPCGVLQDDQWNTYDEALHGVTTFISGYYLAALRAGEEWARRLGDPATAERFHTVFESGRKKLVELCWNGEYFQQYLPDYLNRGGEVGPGCMADQLIGQWWAHQLDLGYLLPREMVVSALRSIFKYNFKSDLTGWKFAPRAFAGGKDKGLIVCTWPKGGRPDRVMLYSDEVWTGIEYQVAGHMIYEGLIPEAFDIVKGARDRYDGIPRPPIPRNPWCEIECGGHYARAMSSGALLLALAGWYYHGPRRVLRFTPRHAPENFKSFFCGPEGWGQAGQSRTGRRQRNEIHVREGRLALAKMILAVPAVPKTVHVRCGNRTIESPFGFNSGELQVALKQPVTIQSGQTLTVEMT
ncbi:MAG: hypothetical protein KGJ60_07170 [Verrucomicrobiota bacterium]|nr:hypothetical protein [Verrucomicrobiota bacterium]